MKNINFVIALLLTALFFSCTKDRTTTIISGNIIQAGSLEPIEGAKVEILQVDDFGGSGGIFTGIIDSVFSDANGDYRWESNRNPGSGWFERGKISKENHFAKTSTHRIDLLGSLWSSDRLFPFAWIKFEIYDNPDLDNEFCEINGLYEIDEHAVFSGDEIHIDTTYGNIDNEIYIKLNPNDEPLIDTIFIDAFDTLTYEIEY